MIGVSLGWTGSDNERQAEHQQKDIPAHANQIQRGRKSYDTPRSCSSVFLFLGLCPCAPPVLAQKQEVTVSLGSVFSQRGSQD
jgi:hypothetical protein